MRTVTIVAAALYTLIAVACDSGESYQERLPPVPLMEGVLSYQSVDSFTEEYSLQGEIAAIESADCVPSKRRPCFVVETVKIKNSAHIGLSGHLEIAFFNDRLAEIRFYPENADAYVRAVGSKLSIDFDELSRGHLRDHLYVRATEDYQNRTYVAWADRRLLDEQYRWIAKYA